MSNSLILKQTQNDRAPRVGSRRVCKIHKLSLGHPFGRCSFCTDEDNTRWEAEQLEQRRALRRDYQRRYRQANPEKVRRLKQKWNAAHKSRVLSFVRRWQENNPDKRRSYDSTRRARVAGVDCTLTTSEWTEIKAYFGHHCAYCPARATTQDHIQPIILGGPHTADNVVPACQACNSSKGGKTLLQWCLAA